MIESASNHTLQLLAKSLLLTKDGVGIFDKNDKLIFCNDAMGELFGVSASKALGESFRQLCLRCFNGNTGLNIESSSFDNWMSYAQAKRRSSDFRSFETDTQGGKWYLVTEQVVDQDYLYVHFTDITEKKANETALQTMSDKLTKIVDRDHLTEVYNRRYFYKKGHAEFNRSRRLNQALSVLILDLDRFKDINDNYGHAAGDMVLKAFSNAIVPLLREYDTFARIGGEEFALLLPATNSNEAQLISERIRTTIAKLTIPFESQQLKVTTSIGVTGCSSELKTFDEMMHLADTSLYRAKSQGRNQTIVA